MLENSSTTPPMVYTMDAKNLQIAIEQNQIKTAFAKKEPVEVRIYSKTRPKSTGKKKKGKRKSGHEVGDIPKTGNTYERKAIYSVEGCMFATCKPCIMSLPAITPACLIKMFAKFAIQHKLMDRLIYWI